MLREHSEQQRDGQLRAQGLQQLQEAGTTGGNAQVGEESAGGPSLIAGHRHHLGPACTALYTSAHLPGAEKAQGNKVTTHEKTVLSPNPCRIKPSWLVYTVS